MSDNPYVPLPRYEPDDYATTVAKAYSIRNMQAADRQRQQELRERDQSFGDAQAIRSAYAKGAGDRAETIRALYLAGIPAAAAAADQMQAQDLDAGTKQAGVDRTQAETARTNQEIDANQLKALATHNDYIASHLQDITKAPATQKQNIYSARRTQMIQQGALQAGSPQDPGEIYPGDAAIHSLQMQTLSAKDAIANQLAQLRFQQQVREFQQRGNQFNQNFNATQVYRNQRNAQQQQGIGLRRWQALGRAK